MSDARPKLNSQVRAIFGEAKRCGLDNDALHELVADVLRGNSPTPESAVSIAKLTYTEAERVIQRLKGQSFVPRRTLQYRRQKAGIQEVVQQAQLDKIAALASQREWNAQTLINFCRRQCGHYPLRTTADANKVIEGLKAMNSREGLWAA